MSMHIRVIWEEYVPIMKIISGAAEKSWKPKIKESHGVFTNRISQSRLPLLAVFDGMGGESCGEMASYLAADSCGKYYQENKSVIRREPEQFLQGFAAV